MASLKFIQIVNYEGKYESIRADQIESIIEPGSGVHDNGAVVLLGGRRIALGQGQDQAKRLLRELQEP
jgi:hypothetical protein